MALPIYLAMTGSEFTSCCPANYFPAWMACHFSPYGSGLSNFPPTLPQNSLLILNDQIEPHGHDKDVITKQLQQLLHYGKIHRILLDFQRPKNEITVAIAEQIINSLPCLVCVTEQYADGNQCPILLPPIDPHIAPESKLGNFPGREIWLELSYSPKTVRITGNGATFSDGISQCSTPEHYEPSLHCHYKITIREDAANFFLYRTPGDLRSLLNAAQDFHVTCGIGLYQEFFPKCI